MSCEPAVERALRESGARVTEQRAKILAALRHADGHQTAEAIHRRVQRDDPATAISLSTVYRTLDALERRGVVAGLGGPGATAAYEWVHREEPHHHLVCRSCDAAVELDLEAVRALADEIERRTGFAADVRHLGIRGECERCRRSPSGR